MASAADRSSQFTNRLSRETSPYLLQHAHNPVDWYAWGHDAFEAARAQDKPIFLSVGYSTCYWCHVMERQCFENEAIASLMNDLFINIKVDREERPDVDQLYMTAVQVLTRHGGWPMSVFLLPDLKPFYGGTYFPPEDAHGRAGFPTVLRAISDAYRNRRDDVSASANQLVSILERLARPVPSSKPMTIDQTFIDELIDRSTSDIDPQFGGFGSAPKFPRETLLELLLTYCSQPVPPGDSKSAIGNRQSAILKMLRHTLDAMANGGIRDHLGGGFHRYSTDERWLVPHFEIMLYDNAMLGWCYVEAHRQIGEARYARIARGIYDFVLREMSDPQGAFYTAFDAEVDAQEGLSYLWTRDEINRILDTRDADLFSKVYGLDRGPNFADPHHGSGVRDRNILYLPDGPTMEDDPRIAAMRKKLYEARRQRKQPLRDTKIITSWNALMIRALAFGGKVLNDEKYIKSAATAADFLLRNHRSEDGRLWRTSRDRQYRHNGFLDDYAFLAQAFLALHDAGDRSQPWRDHAGSLVQSMKNLFADPTGGFYFTEREASDLIIRQMIGSDSPLPSGNAFAAMVSMDLEQSQIARDTLATFAAQLQANAEGMSSMLEAALLHVRQHGPIAVDPVAEMDRGDELLSPQELAAGVVTVQAAWHDPRTLELRLQILRGFHIQSNHPSKNLIATDLRPAGDVDVESIEFPPPVSREFAFADVPVDVYENQLRVLVRFKSNRTAKPAVRFNLHYQACDDSACLPPVSRQIEVPAPAAAH